mmetsp:Transcript_16721/g.23590  ORF Transcript_16721/g.23590 Transcript_16721/m.23590 type:complete len:236 (-) Transcript_16721:44-751(-)
MPFMTTIKESDRFRNYQENSTRQNCTTCKRGERDVKKRSFLTLSRELDNLSFFGKQSLKGAPERFFVGCFCNHWNEEDNSCKCYQVHHQSCKHDFKPMFIFVIMMVLMIIVILMIIFVVIVIVVIVIVMIVVVIFVVIIMIIHGAIFVVIFVVIFVIVIIFVVIFVLSEKLIELGAPPRGAVFGYFQILKIIRLQLIFISRIIGARGRDNGQQCKRQKVVLPCMIHSGSLYEKII